MLKYKILLPITILAIAVGVSLDFYFFKFWPRWQFYFHNLMALLVGLALAGFSVYLLNRQPARHELLYLNLTIGLIMISIHLTKMIIGKCI